MKRTREQELALLEAYPRNKVKIISPARYYKADSFRSSQYRTLANINIARSYAGVFTKEKKK